MLYPFKLGLLLGLGIIISIGSQNLFVIRQGLRREHSYLCALSCFLCDFLLIILGVSGISALLITLPMFQMTLLVCGSAFLFLYGGAAIKRGFHPAGISQSLAQLSGQRETISISKLILFTLSFSLLNPQAILDTMVIIGGNANHYIHHDKLEFVLGAITASLIWFLGLTVATNYFADRVLNVKFWRALEFLSGIIMLGFAIKFLMQMMRLI